MIFNKSINTPRLVFIFFLLFCFHELGGTSAFAQENDPSSFFKQGTEASRDGNHQLALSLFRQAEAAGLNKPSLYYNIGVCAYRLGHYDEAEKAFRKTAEFTDMAPLAYYNLGIVAEKRGEREKAIEWLTRSADSAAAGDEKTRELALYALRKLNVEKQVSIWNTYLSLGLGYDDNVELVATDLLQASNQEDVFLDLFLFLRHPFSHERQDTGSYLQTTLSYLKYEDLTEYDTGSAGVEYAYWKNIASFQIEGGAGYQYILLDGTSYEQSPLLSIQARYFFDPATSVKLRYRVNYHDVLDEDYDYLTGWRHRTQLELFRKWGGIGTSLAYTLELNDRDDKDYSPTRHSLGAALLVKLTEKINANLRLSYRDSDYDISGADDREEEQYDASLELIYALPAGWEVSCRYQYTDNQSNDEYYDYSRNMVVMSVARFF